MEKCLELAFLKVPSLDGAYSEVPKRNTDGNDKRIKQKPAIAKPIAMLLLWSLSNRLAVHAECQQMCAHIPVDP